MKNKTTVCFCPRCGSPSIEFKSIGLLDEGAVPAKCCACDWTGTTSELLASPIQHDQGSDDEMLERWSSELRNLYAECMGKPFAKFLARWGFLPALSKDSTQAEVGDAGVLFARYVAVMGTASAAAVLGLRRQLEVERVRQAVVARGGYDA